MLIEFLISGPGGALAATLLYISRPFGFPYGESTGFFRAMVTNKEWKRVDFFGAFASLVASILLVFALQQGGVIYAWNSATIVAIFIVSAALWAIFIAWERHLSASNTTSEPIFPWRLAQNRFVLGLLL